MARIGILVCTVTLVLCGAMVGVAETARSVFEAIETQGRIVELDEEIVGRLTVDEYLSGSGDRVQAWLLDVPLYEEVQVDLKSDAFDPVLYIVGPGLDQGIMDDDGGGGFNARVCFFPDRGGEYRAVVSSIDDNVGPFSITARVSDDGCNDFEEIVDLATIPTSSRSFSAGETVDGALTESDLRWHGFFSGTSLGGSRC